MNRVLVWTLSLFLASAVAFAAVYTYTDIFCPDSVDTGVSDYNVNRPIVAVQDLRDTTHYEIANNLVQQWLNYFKAGNVRRAIRLVAYEIERITVRKTEDKLVASVTFSVKPTRCNYENWIAGNGEDDGAWIRHKFLFFSIIKEGDFYKVEGVGSGL